MHIGFYIFSLFEKRFHRGQSNIYYIYAQTSFVQKEITFFVSIILQFYIQSVHVIDITNDIFKIRKFKNRLI